MNKLVDELATVALANFDAKTRFEARAKTGNAKLAIGLLDKFED